MRQIQLYTYKLRLDDKVVAYSPDLEVVKPCTEDAGEPELAELFLSDIKEGKLITQPIGWYLARKKTIRYLEGSGHHVDDMLEEVPVMYAYRGANE